MSDSNHRIFFGEERSNWIRLRTLILLRWVAIGGQLTALTVAQRLYHLQLELGLCYLAVGVSVVGNLIAIFVFPENKRLTETENFLMVLFDLLQLSFLLYLTGGLHNPFALLMIGPVTVRTTVEPPDGEPDMAWMLEASEALGDSALEMASGTTAEDRVDSLMDLLGTIGDHEKLIQALAEACREAHEEACSVKS